MEGPPPPPPPDQLTLLLLNCDQNFSKSQFRETQRNFPKPLYPAENHQYPGNIQRLFRLQNCLIRKSSISQKYSKTFSPAKVSQPQPATATGSSSQQQQSAAAVSSSNQQQQPATATSIHPSIGICTTNASIC